MPSSLRLLIFLLILSPFSSQAESGGSGIVQKMQDLVQNENYLNAEYAFNNRINELIQRGNLLSSYLQIAAEMKEESAYVEEKKTELASIKEEYERLFDFKENNYIQMLWGQSFAGTFVTANELADLLNYAHNECNSRVENGKVIVTGPKELGSQSTREIILQYENVMLASEVPTDYDYQTQAKFSNIPKIQLTQRYVLKLYSDVHDSFPEISITYDLNTDEHTPTRFFGNYELKGIRKDGFMAVEAGKPASVVCEFKN